MHCSKQPDAGYIGHDAKVRARCLFGSTLTKARRLIGSRSTPPSASTAHASRLACGFSVSRLSTPCTAGAHAASYKRRPVVQFMLLLYVDSLSSCLPAFFRSSAMVGSFRLIARRTERRLALARAKLTHDGEPVMISPPYPFSCTARRDASATRKRSRRPDVQGLCTRESLRLAQCLRKWRLSRALA